jgi:hypothetical protein
MLTLQIAKITEKNYSSLKTTEIHLKLPFCKVLRMFLTRGIELVYS